VLSLKEVLAWETDPRFKALFDDKGMKSYGSYKMTMSQTKMLLGLPWDKLNFIFQYIDKSKFSGQYIGYILGEMRSPGFIQEKLGIYVPPGVDPKLVYIARFKNGDQLQELIARNFPVDTDNRPRFIAEYSNQTGQRVDYTREMAKYSDKELIYFYELGNYINLPSKFSNYINAKPEDVSQLKSILSIAIEYNQLFVSPWSLLKRKCANRRSLEDYFEGYLNEGVDESFTKDLVVSLGPSDAYVCYNVKQLIASFVKDDTDNTVYNNPYYRAEIEVEVPLLDENGDQVYGRLTKDVSRFVKYQIFERDNEATNITEYFFVDPEDDSEVRINPDDPDDQAAIQDGFYVQEIVDTVEDTDPTRPRVALVRVETRPNDAVQGTETFDYLELKTLKLMLVKMANNTNLLNLTDEQNNDLLTLTTKIDIDVDINMLPLEYVSSVYKSLNEEQKSLVSLYLSWMFFLAQFNQGWQGPNTDYPKTTAEMNENEVCIYGKRIFLVKIMYMIYKDYIYPRIKDPSNEKVLKLVSNIPELKFRNGELVTDNTRMIYRTLNVASSTIDFKDIAKNEITIHDLCHGIVGDALYHTSYNVIRSLFNLSKNTDFNKFIRDNWTRILDLQNQYLNDLGNYQEITKRDPGDVTSGVSVDFIDDNEGIYYLPGIISEQATGERIESVRARNDTAQKNAQDWRVNIDKYADIKYDFVYDPTKYTKHTAGNL
jgi:hypothetical protein